MKRLVAGFAVVAAVLGELPAGHARGSRQQTFKAGVELVQLDVSVLDKQRRPVRGLTAADFTVREEGEPRPIQTFVAVDVPDLPPPTARWQVEEQPDVTSNHPPAGRIVVIVVDDRLLGGLRAHAWSIPKVRAVAHDIIDRLGPADLAAVHFTKNNETGQGLTGDRGKLLTAIDTAPALQDEIDFRQDEIPYLRPANDPCECGLCSINALARVSESLRSISGRHKTVFYIGPGVSIGGSYCGYDQSVALTAAFRQAQLANVTIHPFDPKGLNTGMNVGARGSGRALGGVVGIRGPIEFLKNLAHTTGSLAAVNTNDPERLVAAALDESKSYYLLGFSPAVASSPDGKLRRVKVTVNRRDVTVRARSGFFPAVAGSGRTGSATGAGAGPAIGLADSAPAAGIPMRATVAPITEADGRTVLAVALDAELPVERLSRTGVRLLALVVNQDGRALTTRPVELAPSVAQGAEANVSALVATLPIAPGRYEVRLGLETGDDTIGSVYAPADVPDFQRAPLSMSGLVIGSAPPNDASLTPLPVKPTARRDFSRSDRATAWFQVHQGGTSALQSATVSLRVVDAADKRVVDELIPLHASAFGTTRAADVTFDLPLQRLGDGEYLLDVNVTAGSTSTHRSLRFRVR